MLELLERIAKKTKNKMPPTAIYNEGWMLRLILAWFEENSQKKNLPHELSFYPNAVWYSEALLPTQFKRIPKNNPKAQDWNKYTERHTNADGVIGHFEIGTKGRKGNLELLPGAEQFVVVEAKMFSLLASRTSKISEYNQAARNVACMAEVLRRSKSNKLSHLRKLGFYVIGPEEQLSSKKGNSFHEWISKDSLENVILERIELHKDITPNNEGLTEFEKSLRFLMEQLDTRCISWESVIESIKSTEGSSDYGNRLESFYNNCTEYNRPNYHKTVEEM
jgi:hypothetical protein